VTDRASAVKCKLGENLPTSAASRRR